MAKHPIIVSVIKACLLTPPQGYGREFFSSYLNNLKGTKYLKAIHKVKVQDILAINNFIHCRQKKFLESFVILSNKVFQAPYLGTQALSEQAQYKNFSGCMRAAKNELRVTAPTKTSSDEHFLQPVLNDLSVYRYTAMAGP